MLPPKARSRYLPTLTHIVTKDVLVSPGAGELASGNESLDCKPEVRVQAILDLLIPSAMTRIRVEMQACLEAQLHLSELKLRAEVEAVVRYGMTEDGAFPEP